MLKTYSLPDGHQMTTIEFGHGDLILLPTIDEEGKTYLGISPTPNNEKYELGVRVGKPETFYTAKPDLAMCFTTHAAIDNLISSLNFLKTLTFKR